MVVREAWRKAAGSGPRRWAATAAMALALAGVVGGLADAPIAAPATGPIPPAAALPPAPLPTPETRVPPTPAPLPPPETRVPQAPAPSPTGETRVSQVSAPFPTGETRVSQVGDASAGEAAPGVVTGTLEQLWAHRRAPGVPIMLAAAGTTGEAAVEQQSWLITGDQRYRLAPGSLDSAPSGSQVTVNLGVPIDGLHPVLDLTSSVPPQPAVLDGVMIGSGETLDFGVLPGAVTHRFTLVLAVPPGASPDSTTISSFQSTVTGPVASFWSAQSRGQRAISVAAAHSWVSLTTPCSNPFGLWSEVASRVGWTTGTRKHLLVYLPPSAGCGAGLGTVGPTSESGGRMWTSYDSADVIAHEFGHNLGLGHSQGLLCPSTSDATYSGGWPSGCGVHGYRDWYDVMGISWDRLGSLAAPHADRLSLLPSTAKITVSSPVTARLSPMTSNALRVARIDDPGGTYYVEYRTAAGQDAWLTGNWRGLDAGVLVRRVSPTDGRESLLLDGTVTGGTRTADWRAALTTGQSLTTASGQHRIRVDSADATGATVSFIVAGQAPTPTPSLPAGTAVVFGNPDTATVAAGTVAFSGAATAPEGTVLWEVTEGATVRARGYTGAGANGTPGPFHFSVSLPAGTYQVSAWIPDESDGEGAAGVGPNGSPGYRDEVTVTVT